MTDSVVISALYHFADFPDYKEFRPALLDVCQHHKIKGTLLLASEGINGTIAGTRAGIDAVLAFIRRDSRFASLIHKESFSDSMPFLRLKVRLKKEIVTLGVGPIDVPNMTGEHVDAERWNEIISDPEVVLIDTRNNYEFDIGSFDGALNPDTESFREFPDYIKKNFDPNKHKKVAMFCTGGIRCEKASAYMKAEGFENVYQLDGGILKYLETMSQDKTKWHGDCFVFDSRVAVNHELAESEYDLCHGCRQPITDEDKKSAHYEAGVCCPKCYNTRTDAQKASARERQKQADLARQRGVCHIGS